MGKRNLSFYIWHKYTLTHMRIWYDESFFFFNISAVVVAGQPAAGKSAAVRTVLAAFNSKSLGSCDIRLTRVYPGAFEDPGQFCGHVCQSGEWREGVLTNLIKKAHKVWRKDIRVFSNLLPLFPILPLFLLFPYTSSSSS